MRLNLTDPKAVSQVEEPRSSPTNLYFSGGDEYIAVGLQASQTAIGYSVPDREAWGQKIQTAKD